MAEHSDDAGDTDLDGYRDLNRRKPRGLRFDPTVNAGHLLTFISLGIAVVVSWSSLDKRVVVLEERGAYQKLRDDTQDAAVTQQLVEIKEAVREVRRVIDEQRREQLARDRQPGKL